MMAKQARRMVALTVILEIRTPWLQLRTLGVKYGQCLAFYSGGCSSPFNQPVA
jgi:hypothetical protein